MLLWIGHSISVLGNRFYSIALMWYIIERTGSSLALGISVLCFTLPSILLMPFAGVIADGNRKKQILIVTDLINGALMLLIAILVSMEHVPLILLYGSMITASSMTAFFNPVMSATVPLISGKDHLMKANSLTQMTTQLTNILGPALAGVMIALTDMWLLFFLNGLSFIISAIVEVFLMIPNVYIGKTKQNFRTQFKEGLIHVLGTRKLLYLVIVGGVVINFFLAPLYVYITVICNQILEVGSKGMGIVDASIAIGALCGSIFILAKFISNNIKIVILGLSIEGIALLTAGLYMNYTAMIIFALILGFGISLASVGISTLFQTIVPDNKRGRVSSLTGTLASCTIPLGTLYGSYIINHISISVVLIFSGVAVTLAGLTLIIPFADLVLKKKRIVTEEINQLS